MSSLTRRIQRRRIRAKEGYEPATQPTVVLPNGYITLHPTKGYRHVSARRAAAFAMLDQRDTMRQMQAMVAAQTPNRPSRVYGQPTKRELPQGTITRQRRRAAVRYGQELAA